MSICNFNSQNLVDCYFAMKVFFKQFSQIFPFSHLEGEEHQRTQIRMLLDEMNLENTCPDYISCNG